MLGTAKNAIVVWIGIVFLGDEVTSLQGGGYALSLAGFFAYNYLKLQQPAGANHTPTSARLDWPQLPITSLFAQGRDLHTFQSDNTSHTHHTLICRYQTQRQLYSRACHR